ncbi:MAG: hypothetical protein ACRDHL_10890 [Candidatus Promineifilaceae bacterium]
MTRPHPKITTSQLRRPTLDTRYHIDFDWWEKAGLDLKAYLLSRLQLPDESALDMGVEQVDQVDADTGEVRRLDSFQYAVQRLFDQMPEEFSRQASLVDAVFFALLARGNKPTSVRDLGRETGRDPQTILRTLSGTRIYQGIRPLFDES